MRAETRARLGAEGTLIDKGDAGTPSGVTFGGEMFVDLALRLVEVERSGDKRPLPGSDGLRPGTAFLSSHPKPVQQYPRNDYPFAPGRSLPYPEMTGGSGLPRCLTGGKAQEFSTKILGRATWFIRRGS